MPRIRIDLQKPLAADCCQRHLSPQMFAEQLRASVGDPRSGRDGYGVYGADGGYGGRGWGWVLAQVLGWV